MKYTKLHNAYFATWGIKQVSTTWETIDRNNTTAINTDFVLTAFIPDLANYKDGGNQIT